MGQIHLIRHGTTEANIAKMYYGSTDLPLSNVGIDIITDLVSAKTYPKADGASLYTTGLLRTEQTFFLIYGCREHDVVPELREYQFGEFEMKTAICSMISIPLPFTPVPINLATLSVFLAGGLLGSKYGALSQLIYVLLGAIGLPVFHSFTGGLSVLMGPTGGYIIGYIAAAWLIGFLIEKLGHGYYKNIISMISGLAVCYALGTLWFMYVTSTGLAAALMMCLVPFLIGDAVKIVAGSILVKKLHKLI